MIINLLELPVYYINLEEDFEKRKSTDSLLKRCGFQHVQRINAIKHEKGRIVGCARSHYEILKIAKPPFILLEDDCVISEQFNSQIMIPDDSDALYLGISHWGRYLNHSGPYVHYQKINDEIVRIYNMLATHAILYLSESYVEICKRISYYYGYQVEAHLDIGFAEIHKFYNVYALDSPIFKQHEWNNVTSDKISNNGFNKQKSEILFNRVLQSDENYYKINSQFKSPIKPLIEMRDISGVPGYYLPTRIM